LTGKTGWSCEFDDPIPIPGGRVLVTLRDAADYITSLPRKKPRFRNGRRRSRF
jgi:hypothetical protein